jgi:DNA-binding transcriptional LysR family regulator
MLNLHRMRLLVELSRRGTLAQVAEALAFSPSTVSQQLGQLEVEAGVKLIEPVGRGVRLTSAGQLLVRHAEQILQQVDRAEAALATTRSEISGEVRVATFQTAAMSLIPRLLDVAAERHPALTLFLNEIQPDTAAAALLAREFDLVLNEEYPGHAHPPAAGIDRRSLFSDKLRIYAGESWSPLSRRRQLGDFADVPWILEPRGKPAREWAESVCRAAGFEPQVRFESADLFVHAQLVESGHAVALLPDLVWQSRRPAATFIGLPDEPLREVHTSIRAGSEDRPVLVELRRMLGDVAESRHPEASD